MLRYWMNDSTSIEARSSLDATSSAIHLYFKAIPFFVVASLWYLFFTTVLSIGQFYFERYYARGSSRNLPPTPLQKLLKRNLSWRRTVYTVAPGTPAGEEHR